ncbi:MAG: Na+/H+ antiporter subunit B [Bryobacteraceae bacterium]
MRSLILYTATRFLKPILILFSLITLYRGHDDPGGGFVGGLIAAAAYSMQAISEGVGSTRRSLRIDPHVILGSGLLVAAGSGVVGLLQGEPWLTGQWRTFTGPAGLSLKLSTVMVFDAGVYLVVVGTVLLVLFTLAEE